MTGFVEAIIYSFSALKLLYANAHSVYQITFIIGVLLIQAKRIEAKERIQVGIGLVAIKKTVKP